MNLKISKERKPRGMTPAGALALAMLASATAVSADGSHGDAGKACDNSTLRGDYGIQMQGSVPTPPVPPTSGAMQSVIGVLMRSYDGRGGFEQTDNIKGSLTEFVPDRPGYGTYEVFPDCTAVALNQPDASNPNLVIEEKLVIVDNGNETRSITVLPVQFMVTTVGKRVKSR